MCPLSNFLSTPVLHFNLSRNQKHIGKVIWQQTTAAKSSHLLPKVLGVAGWECAVSAWQLRNLSQAEKKPVNTVPLPKRCEDTSKDFTKGFFKLLHLMGNDVKSHF